MGYESKLYVVEQKPLAPGTVWNRIIAVYDLCKMGLGFDYSLFNKTLEGKIFISKDEETDVDRYDNKLKYCDKLQLLIDELEKEELFDSYRRIPPLVSMLKSFLEHEKDF